MKKTQQTGLGKSLFWHRPFKSSYDQHTKSWAFCKHFVTFTRITLVDVERGDPCRRCHATALAPSMFRKKKKERSDPQEAAIVAALQAAIASDTPPPAQPRSRESAVQTVPVAPPPTSNPAQVSALRETVGRAPPRPALMGGSTCHAESDCPQRESRS